MSANATDRSEDWVYVCLKDDVFEGTGRRYEMPGFPPLAVFNVAGEIFVTDDTCSHGNASLSEGWVEGDEVECPFHSGKFCVRDGRPTAYPCELPIRTYRSRLDGERVLVEPPPTDR